ncbi:MAG: 50S ribosomal protein L21 [Mycobacteriales bacterium]
MYAIIRAGGRQYKVAVGDVVEVDRLSAGPGAEVVLPALLVVDGDRLTTDVQALSAVTVRAEVVRPTRGPKIDILKYKNKTGYRKRQGHRQHHTELRVTGIDAGAGSAESTGE